MVSAIRRPASSIHWAVPGGHACSLSPMSGGQGMLEIEIQEGMVVIHSRNCLLIERGPEESYTELGEFESTMSLDRCQITWHSVQKEDNDDVERSKYFRQ